MAIGASTFALLSLASSGVEAIGQVQEGRQRADAENFNAQISKQQAEIVKVRGRLDVMRQRRIAKSFTSEQQALYSKAGVVLSGSPLKVIEESAANAELDILLTEFDTATQARRLESEAERSKELARAEKSSGYVRAGKTLLTASANAALLYSGGTKVPGAVKTTAASMGRAGRTSYAPANYYLR